MKKSLFSLICGLGLVNVSNSVAQCVVAGTDFDTNAELCCPDLTPDNKPGGWYDENLDLTKVCKSDMFTGPEYAIQKGIGGVFTSEASNDMTKVDDVFHLGSQIQKGDGQYGYSAVTAQPKLVHPFFQANKTSNNMYVNIGSAENSQFLTYTVHGLEPGSNVELSFTLYNLLDPTYFEYLATEVCKGTGAGVKQIQDFITKYSYSNTGVIRGNDLGIGVISTDQNIQYNTGYNNSIQTTGVVFTKATADYGDKTVVTHKAKVPETGSISFLIFRTNDCFQIPIGIDDIKVTGSIKPVLSSTGNPCPEQPLRVFTKQNYPEGTTFSWKESKTGQSSTTSSFNFVPDEAEKEYSITLEVTLPGCTPSKSDVYKVKSGTCCTSSTGAPMAMTNLFFDDFGNFVSDDTYEWTDRFGTTHSEKIPVGQVHTSQSHGSDIKIPYVKAYNIESSGATLAVPLAGGTKPELYNHGVYVVSKYGGYPGGVKYDNSGTTTGGMLQFDLEDDGSQDEFFEIDIEHICTGKEITFGADFASISNHPGCIEVQLLYGNTVLASAYESFTGGAVDSWKNVNKKFKVKAEDVNNAQEVSITMKVKHSPGCVPAGDSDSRDYGIDNIIFQVCTPPDVNVESSVTKGTDILDLCTEDILKLTSVTSDAVKRFYLSNAGDKIGYVYQYTFQDPSTESETNPITWETLHSDEVITEETFDVEVDKYWDNIFSKLEDDPAHEKRIYFRVVVGEYSDLIADQSWKKNSAFSPCRKISISTIPVVAGLNCAACTKPDPVDFSAVGGKFNATKKTVELCSGESTVLGMANAVHGVDKDNNDYSNYDVKWFKEDVTSTALETKKCVTGTDDVAPTITVDYADVEAAGAAGVKYIISLHDYFDPASPTTSCDIKDTIIVIANPAPKETLSVVDPFCEGTLATEPTKTIAGYTIQWFATETDTLAASEITEPVVATVTKAESPKSFYYVLTDATTGCRGDANEYKIVVNKADANPVSGKIDYMKTEAVGGALKPLDQQSTVLNTALVGMTDYEFYVGLVTGATTQTEPTLASATLGAASIVIPAPSIVDPASPDDEYLWYYTYLKSKDGCLSDTVLVGVTIKGAPSPTTKNAAYCVNSTNVAEMSTYAELALNTTGTLNFYDTDKTTPMAATDKPSVTTPGKYTYWASQTGTGGESSKQPIVIDVYGVNDVALSEATHDYCLNETAAAVETIASVATSTNDHVVNTAWEFFSGETNEPTQNVEKAGAATTMPVATTVAGVYKYYARLKYEIGGTSTEVCYGKHEEYTVTVQSVEAPSGTGAITYLKSDGPSFKIPTLQDATGVVADAGCTLVWYDDAMTPITEAEATPVYNASLTGNVVKKYNVTQKNALGCESQPKTVTIMVSGYPTPTVTPLNVCENSPKLTGTLTATANGVAGGDPASNFELIWYNAQADGSMDGSQEFPSIALSPTIQKAGTTKETVYTYYVLQRIIGQPAKQSAAVPVTVTVNANPKLTKLVTDPKCLGESQDLKEMYDINIQNCDAQHVKNGTTTPVSPIVTEPGVYLVKGSYIINSGKPEQETCSSEQEELNVIFHELKADIIGSDRTCPGVPVDLDLDLTLGGGLTESGLTYKWSNNLNSTTDTRREYNTGATGLDNAGDVMRVSVEVSSAACNGNNAVTKQKTITVGDGPLVGKIKFSEANNSDVKDDVISSNNLSFNSCGGKVKVELIDLVNKDGGSYTLSGSESSTGTFTNETAGSATLNLGAGTYMVSYINECPTKFEFEIVDKSAKASSRPDELTICENQTWSAEIINLVGPSNTTIEWQHDGTPIVGQTGTKLELNPARPSDSGVYSFSLLSAGCRFDSKIAMGSPLTVKPYAKFDKASFKDYYEIINGDPLDITIGFTEPTNSANIADGVKWSGYTNPNGVSLNIPSVERDYNIRVVAENDLYCMEDTDIVVKVDARLAMTADLDRNYMCEGEKHELIVDTTGTGHVLHPAGLVLVATETIGTSTKNLTLKPKNGMLVAEISPSRDATYNVTYTYTTGSQDKSLLTPLSMRVYEACKVSFAKADAVCGDGLETVTLLVSTNSSVEELDWKSGNPSVDISGNMTGASIVPIHSGSNNAFEFQKITVIAKNQYCDPAPFDTTIEVHKPLEGSIFASSKICQFDELSLDATSYSADTYEWVYEEKADTLYGGKVSLVPDPDFANFSLHMTRGKCKADDYKMVEVTYAPVVMQVDSITYKTVEFQLDGDGSTGPYSFIIDGNENDENLTNPLRSEVPYGTHSLKVVDQVGCITETTFVVNSPEIIIPNLVSPDDNGVNDKFVVHGLAAGYPDAKVTIYDRWGKQLASYKAGDGTDWDGVYNGTKMPSTDYWYEIQIKEIQKTYTGHFTLIRQ